MESIGNLVRQIGSLFRAFDCLEISGPDGVSVDGYVIALKGPRVNHMKSSLRHDEQVIND